MKGEEEECTYLCDILGRWIERYEVRSEEQEAWVGFRVVGQERVVGYRL